MKKILLSLFLIGLFTFAEAQEKPVSFGLKAGITFPYMTVSFQGASVNLDTKTSFYVGGVADVKVNEILSIQPGLMFVNKGTTVNAEGLNFDEGEVEGDGNGTFNFKYIEVPVNLLANIEFANSSKFFFGGGPYYAFAVDGNVKSGDMKEDIDFGSDGLFKRSDFGFNLLTGYQLKNGLNLHLNYSVGISSIVQEQEGDVKFKNRAFSFGLGFMF